MLYRIELPSNTTTPLALFRGGLRIELSCRRAAVFGAWHVVIRIEFFWVGDPRLQRKQRFSATDRLDGISISDTGIIFNGRTDGRTHEKTGWENNVSPLTCGRMLILHIRDAFYWFISSLSLVSYA